jgi:hypothetical protein
MSEFDETIDDDDDDGRLDPKGLLHRALLTGVSAVMLTEEGIRNALGELRVPKETIGNLAQQAERSRREIFQALSGDVKGFLKSFDAAGTLRKALTGLRLEVRADVKFIDDNDVETKVTTKIRDAANDAVHERQQAEDSEKLSD